MSVNDGVRARVLVLDHRDSFVFILVDHFARLGAEVRTLRTCLAADQLQHEIGEFDPDLVLLSPGPGHPASAGVMVPFLRSRPERPVLGVCLGHQAMALAFEGTVGQIDPVHGRGDQVSHAGDRVFDGIPTSFRAARYHSLAVTEVPPCFDVIAHTKSAPRAQRDRLVMAMRHRELPYVGMQFHPESVLTPFGTRLVSNVLEQALDYRSRSITSKRS